jgi:hypothetical protein
VPAGAGIRTTHNIMRLQYSCDIGWPPKPIIGLRTGAGHKKAQIQIAAVAVDKEKPVNGEGRGGGGSEQDSCHHVLEYTGTPGGVEPVKTPNWGEAVDGPRYTNSLSKVSSVTNDKNVIPTEKPSGL